MMFPFEKALIQRKVESAHETIDKALEHMKAPYIAWSGGKDSTVVLHLVIQHRPDIPVVFLDADCNHAATDEFIAMMVKRFRLNFVRFPTKPLLDIVAKYAYTMEMGKQAMKHCVYEPVKKLVKEHGFDGVFLGVRAEESYGRSKLLRAQGKLFYNKTYGVWECLPIGWWSADDVWRYIEAFRLPYNPLYDETLFADRNLVRVSYFAGGTNKEAGRLVHLKFYHPDLFNRVREKTRWCGFFS